MNDRTQELLWIGAFRYYCGRMTYVVEMFCSELIAEWANLPERARVVIARDLKQEFRRDDYARKHDLSFLPLGHDMDRREWQRVWDYISKAEGVK